RRMFPVLHFVMGGLEPSKLYHVYVDMVVADNSHWKFQGGTWISCGTAEVLPESEYTMEREGERRERETWRRKKLLKKEVILNSMHRYQPQIHIVEDQDDREGECILSHAFVDTQFIAVTAYQNTDITQLKIDNNPFAKGFRENFDSRIAVANAMDIDSDLPLTSMQPLTLAPQGQIPSLTGLSDPAGAHNGGYGYSPHPLNSGPHGMMGTVGAAHGGHQGMSGRPRVVGVTHAQSPVLSQAAGGGTVITAGMMHGNGTSSFSAMEPHPQQYHPHYMHNFLEQSSPLSLNDSSGSHNSASALSQQLQQQQQQQQQQQHPSQYYPSSFGNNSPSVASAFERSHGHAYFQYPQQQQQQQGGQYRSDAAYQGFSTTNSRANTPVTQPSSCNFGQSINLLEQQQEKTHDLNYPALEQIPQCAAEQQSSYPGVAGISGVSGVSPNNFESCMRGYGVNPVASTSATSALEPLPGTSTSAALTHYSSAQALYPEGPPSLPSRDERLYGSNQEKYCPDASNMRQLFDIDTDRITGADQSSKEISPRTRNNRNDLADVKSNQGPPLEFLPHPEQMNYGNGNVSEMGDKRLPENVCPGDISPQLASCSGNLGEPVAENASCSELQDLHKKSDCRFANSSHQPALSGPPRNDENTANLSLHNASL
ncbi:hypothetical protein EGW08_000581, partial [Elysia chlorotica]